MSEPARRRSPFSDYVRLEAFSNVRHEFLDGAIYAMAGGTPLHAHLAARVIHRLMGHLQGTPCAVFSSDLRVRVPPKGLATYPDVTVVCGPFRTDPDDATTVVNPRVLIEVLSDGTEDYDRTEKVDHYKRIETAREIVLVSHREALVEVWSRDDTGPWSCRVARSGDVTRLPSIACDLAVDDLYRDLPAGNARP